MNPDNCKETWQTQTSQTRLTINAELLLEEVQRNQRRFTGIIFWRDVREVGIALLLIPVWIYLGTRSSQPWTWYLTVPALLWVAGFMLVDRIHRKRQIPELGEPLRRGIEGSLAQVEHQIWLLRNVFWWYLLPLILSILAYFSQFTWQERSGGWLAAVAMTLAVSLVVIVMAAVYLVNRKAVRSYLKPRRQELEAQLRSLGDETAAASS